MKELMERYPYSPRRKRRWPIVVIVLLVLIAGYAYYALTRTITLVAPVQSVDQFSAPAEKSTLAWPATDKAAVGIVGSSILETKNDQSPSATASTAKTIAALTILDKYPLKPGQDGPQIKLTDADVALYNAYAAKNGSLVRVQAGEEITQLQMLQAMMLPSANNMADTAAVWAFGSLGGYSAAANAFLAKHNINSTKVGSDASGLLPETTSTPSDLVKIGELAMDNPVLRKIVGTKQINNFPVAGTLTNTNTLLGQEGIVGIKTGNSDQAGYVFLGASETKMNNTTVVIVTAVMSAPNRAAAMSESLTLMKSARTNFHTVEFAKTGDKVGSYSLPWGGSVPVIASKDVSVKVWNSSRATAVLKLDDIGSNTQAGSTVGTLGVGKSATSNLPPVPVTLATTPSQPSPWWRLTHPL